MGPRPKLCEISSIRQKVYRPSRGLPSLKMYLSLSGDPLPAFKAAWNHSWSSLEWLGTISTMTRIPTFGKQPSSRQILPMSQSLGRYPYSRPHHLPRKLIRTAMRSKMSVKLTTAVPQSGRIERAEPNGIHS